MKRWILYWLCILPACYVEPPNPEPSDSSSGSVDESSGSTDATPS